MSDLKKGLLTGVIMYVLGVSLTRVIHLIFDSDGNTLPVSVTVALALIILGLIRIGKNLINIYKGHEKARNKGELIVHIVLFTAVIIYVSSVIYFGNDMPV